VTYFAIKTLHLLFVMSWIAAVFYLPRILLNLVQAGDHAAVRERLVLMGRRLYGFGHVMFGLTTIFGVVLWVQFRITGPWLHAKLSLVILLFVYYVWIGALLKRAAKGGGLPSERALRWINEAPLLLIIPVIYLVIAKPTMW